MRKIIIGTALTMLALTAAACSSSTSQVQMWTQKHGAEFGGIHTDLKNIYADSQSGSTQKMSSDCYTLQVQVAVYNSTDPIPDQALQPDLTDYFASLSTAAQDCQDGIKNQDINQINSMNSELNQAEPDIQALDKGLGIKVE